MNQQIKTPTPPSISSGPNAAGRRFLVTLLEYAFADGWRTPDDFLRHFPASVLLRSLKNATDLRVALLGAATGLHEEILRRKKPALAAEDLHLALEEGMTNSAAIMEAFSAEDRVRYLDPHEIWAFLAGDEFWQQEATASAELIESCAGRMAFTINSAITERLITPRDIIDGLTYEGLASFLSPRDLRTVVSQALAKGRDGVGLSEKVFFEILSLERLCRVVPLETLWSDVVLRCIVIPSGLTTLNQEEGRSSEPPVGPATVLPTVTSVATPVVTRALVPPSMGKTSAPPPSVISRSPTSLPPPIPAHLLPASSRPQALALSAPLAVNGWDDDQAPTAVPPSVASQALPPQPSGPPPDSTSSQWMPLVSQAPLAFLPPVGSSSSPPPEPAEVEQRKRGKVLEHLSVIARLPPNHESLPTPVLSSIDAMYALLPSATDDIQRKSVIRQSFANENYLRSALLGLIALMDSSVDTSNRVIQEAKIEALIKILLFEEQRRKDAGPALGARPLMAPASAGAPSVASRTDWPPVAASPSVVSQRLQAPPSFVPPRSVVPRPGVAPSVPAHPPLPNLPAEPSRSGGRSVPPPLPPGYQGHRR